MEKRVSRDDLRSAVELALGSRQQQQRQRVWWVCDEYVLREDSIVSGHPYLLPPEMVFSKEGDEIRAHWRPYSPIDDIPDLFIRLSSLHEERDFVPAALGFCERYGVPGGSSSERGSRPDRMSIAGFQEEVKRAWLILRMYEAALNRDAAAARSLIPQGWDEIADTDFVPLESSLGKAILEEDGEDGLAEVDLVFALQSSVGLVNDTVKKLCRVEAEPSCSSDPSEIKSVWHFDGLLGAAYLQMFWLMTSAGDLSRCEHCGRIVSLARPYPDGRKRRNDRRFCNDSCRQARHREKKRGV